MARRRAWAFAWAAPVVAAFVACPAAPAQTSAFPGIDVQGPGRGSDRSLLGTAPGSGGAADEAPAPDQPLIGGRQGIDGPRVPTAVARPGSQAPRARTPALFSGHLSAPITQVPAFGESEAATGSDDPGPADGLTLDAAIQRLVRDNLELRAKAFEIPLADADVLTAGLRANPILFTDAQLVPYGRFDRRRPGGPTQYDLNISYPFDLSGKRAARVASASGARSVVEAQYQDAVRLQIDALATAFVDVLAAVDNVRFARSGVEGLGRVLEVTRHSQARGGAGPDDVDRIEIQRDAAEIGLADAEEAQRRAARGLALLLNLQAAEADRLRVRGTVRDTAPPPPPADELIRIALGSRPDLAAFRLGAGRARADVRLARANRYQDVYLQYQPFTYQNNAPFGLASAGSWAVGLAVPLPIWNRNQGNIRRAEWNVAQTDTEVTAVERRVIAEVVQAARDYAVSRAAVGRFEGKLLPTAVRLRDNTLRLYGRGEVEVVAYLNARREANEIFREYRDHLIRHRRQMLALNTAVGRRILP